MIIWGILEVSPRSVVVLTIGGLLVLSVNLIISTSPLIVVGAGLVGGRVRCLVVVVGDLVVLIIIVGGGADGGVGGSVETVVGTSSTKKKSNY